VPVDRRSRGRASGFTARQRGSTGPTAVRGARRDHRPVPLHDRPVILEFADRRVKQEVDAQAVFQLRLLAQISGPPRGPAPATSSGDCAQEESYARLAGSLLFASRHRSRRVMVTCPSPRDGKTTVTLALASALALLGKWVGWRWRRPSAPAPRPVRGRDASLPRYERAGGRRRRGGATGRGRRRQHAAPRGSRAPAGNVALAASGRPRSPRAAGAALSAAMRRVLKECRSLGRPGPPRPRSSPW
jgi:hypothetical protein